MVDRFGDSPALADELVELVQHGPKRATAGLMLAYERSGDPVPQPGWLTVFLDGAGAPRVIVRTTWTDIRPFSEVDAAFAWDEGEGDRSLADWQLSHRRYFSRTCGSMGIRFDERMLVVLERFELVWPIG